MIKACKSTLAILAATALLALCAHFGKTTAEKMREPLRDTYYKIESTVRSVYERSIELIEQTLGINV